MVGPDIVDFRTFPAKGSPGIDTGWGPARFALSFSPVDQFYGFFVAICFAFVLDTFASAQSRWVAVVLLCCLSIFDVLFLVFERFQGLCFCRQTRDPGLTCVVC